MQPHNERHLFLLGILLGVVLVGEELAGVLRDAKSWGEFTTPSGFAHILHALGRAIPAAIGGAGFLIQRRSQDGSVTGAVTRKVEEVKAKMEGTDGRG